MRKAISINTIFIAVVFLTGFAHAVEKKAGSITGRMVKDAVPMTGGIVSFFNEESGPPPDPVRYLRVPDYIVVIDANGRFSAELAEGRYYIGAIKRMSGRVDAGPPREGDYLYISRDEKGVAKSYAVRAGKGLDIGVLSGIATYKPSDTPGKDMTTIEGTITDSAGKPVKGALVQAFKSPADAGKPVFISDERTDSDGKYILRVAGDMKYYLKVREVYGGGPPLPGESSGKYGGDEAVVIPIKKGERLKGIDIRVAGFSGRSPEGIMMFIK